MAALPDPTDTLRAEDRAVYDHIARARAGSDGRSQLADIYVRMFNNPQVAEKIGALGEHLRFHGVLPDDVREMAILRYSSRCRAAYEWSHHQRPAMLAGVTRSTIDELTEGRIPDDLPDASKGVIEAVDAVVAGRSIPAPVQTRVQKTYGLAGVVEVVALCGLYAMMGYMAAAFDIEVEAGLPPAPF